jgi:hypothetical protein
MGKLSKLSRKRKFKSAAARHFTGATSLSNFFIGEFVIYQKYAPSK